MGQGPSQRLSHADAYCCPNHCASLATAASEASRPVQLCGRFCKLVSRLVGRQKSLALQTGWQAGVWPRKPGAAIMEERGARPLLVVALEIGQNAMPTADELVMHWCAIMALALAPSSGVHSGRVIMETGPPSAGACAIFRCRCLPFEIWAESLQVSG